MATKLPFPCCRTISMHLVADNTRSRLNGTVCLRRAAHSLGRIMHFQLSFLNIVQPSSFRNFKRLAWSIRSAADGSGLNSSPTTSSSGGTRLIRAIEALLVKLDARIKVLRKNLPVKLLFFLVGFYCATAFATVIGQTGDWDIISAGLAVAVVEGIGALMYRSIPLLDEVRSFITMFNYWKTGLTLGLFLDSFKY
ncbi:PREDICTED: ycf20-like protein isoform X1 [Nicotiana attenuata]|uniref:Ycf20-like protein n=1 Tax=Nicotiana attenuata TaxID=49451 RepID=A0A314L864_NICAT|nr:PREDICTED: ycf20-like protein isoform X1 [Nicotiana attenuata]XP_019262526.1 PREDICTED: ycf20-like protein isoform X1 [Nicotiana attenuata]OIT37735.1 ycf20-like protein [Nicotiana attenuata]